MSTPISVNLDISNFWIHPNTKNIIEVCWIARNVFHLFLLYFSSFLKYCFLDKIICIDREKTCKSLWAQTGQLIKGREDLTEVKVNYLYAVLTLETLKDYKLLCFNDDYTLLCFNDVFLKLTPKKEKNIVISHKFDLYLVNIQIWHFS